MSNDPNMPTTLSPLAGKPAPREMLVDLAHLEQAYYEGQPDLSDPNQWVSFGTSGHRGSSLNHTFTEAHILAITQAICDHRASQNITGPLYLGRDTHALSQIAQQTALEVLAGNGIETIIQVGDGVTPTPVISRAILVYNRGRQTGLADGIVITPSHNPPEDGGFKYNTPNGGPADTGVTRWVQERANELLRGKNAGVKRMPLSRALRAATTHAQDFILPYVNDLRNGGWAPSSPTLLCGGDEDPTVYFSVNTATMAAFWPAQVAAGLVTVLDVNGTPAGPFAKVQEGFLASQAALLEYYQTAAGGGLSLAAAQLQLIENYHGNVAPFCSLAARSFFSQFVGGAQ